MSATEPSYNCDGDNPKDLLGLLADVASKKIEFEKIETERNEKRDKIREMDIIQLMKKRKAKEPKRKINQQVTNSYTMTQLLTMPAGQLIKLFTVFNGDELKKQYSYACALIPGCDRIFSSFASDAKAKMNIQAHLGEHLERWRNNMKESTDFDYSRFTVTPVTQLKGKSSTAPYKKAKTQPKKSPKENLNKENKETKVGNSITYAPRKGLSIEVNLKELENNANQEIKTVNVQNSYVIEPKKDSNAKVLRDHSYYGHIKEENVKNESAATVTNASVNSTTNENISVMVVEHNEAPMSNSLNSTVKDIANEINAETNKAENMTLYAEDPQPSVLLPAKPKGKAKFIGTSEEEKLKALERMAKIKQYGNPSGSELVCDICNPHRTFTAPTTLISHFRSHANIKPFVCKVCNDTFTRRHSLKYHMLIHDNQTRFTCKDCGKKFRHPSHFREHQRRHTGEAPYGCPYCNQRFKTRNTYKRHLKTRHNKILTVTGDLIHLSEEEAKKQKPNNRRKKSNKNSVAKKPPTSTETIATDANAIFFKEEFNESDAEANNAQEEFVENVDNTQEEFVTNLYVYEEQSTGVADEETYQVMETGGQLPIHKTEFNETEVEDNFANNEVVIAQTDSNGELHFENYNYAQNDNTVYVQETEEYSEERVCTDVTKDAKEDYVNHEETIGVLQEDDDNYTEAINSDFATKTDDITENVYVIENQEEIGASEEVTSTFEELSPSTVEIHMEDQDPIVEDDSSEQNVIIPCQVKVCENNGTATLQLIKNSKLSLLGSKAQSINLIQNGKQQTFLLLASEDDNLLSLTSSAAQESKSLPVQPVIAGSAVQ